MPVLARTLEAAGLSTILVTNMPYWAEKTGVPRTLAVEFPFGHLLGAPHNAEQQRRIIEHALAVLASTKQPGEIVHAAETWHTFPEEAMADWQPPEPSPIIAELTPKFREILRQRRRKKAR